MCQAFGAIEIVLQPLLHYVFPYRWIPEVGWIDVVTVDVELVLMMCCGCSGYCRVGQRREVLKSHGSRSEA